MGLPGEKRQTHHSTLAGAGVEDLDLYPDCACGLTIAQSKGVSRNGLAMPYDPERVWQVSVRMRKAKQMAAKLTRRPGRARDAFRRETFALPREAALVTWPRSARQAPRSSDSRVAGNQDPEAYRRDPSGRSRVIGP